MKKQVSPTVTITAIVVAVLVLAGLIWKLTAGSGFHPTLDKIPGEFDPGAAMHGGTPPSKVSGEVDPGTAMNKMPGASGSVH